MAVAVAVAAAVAAAAAATHLLKMCMITMKILGRCKECPR